MSQGLWGPIQGPSSTSPAPISEDILKVALLGGYVRSLSAGGEHREGLASPVQVTLEDDGDQDAGGDGAGEDKVAHGEDSETGAKRAAGEEKGAAGTEGAASGKEKDGVLWLSLPFVAALLSGASADSRQQAAMSINIVLKVGATSEMRDPPSLRRTIFVCFCSLFFFRIGASLVVSSRSCRVMLNLEGKQRGMACV